ncbi:helix-hairpin-helix domain-containing protein [Corallococcus sp. H22C18031201]|nr:helix-hairpin-helix domain-containing protein [Corallococcus sp. H22C18031201]
MAGRTAALAVVALGLVGAGWGARWIWPSQAASLACEPAQVRLTSDGIATCGPGAVPTGGQALALGRKLDLNRALESELARLPGVGPRLARSLVDARASRGGFTDWAQVDAVSGVGSARLETLRAATDLGPSAGDEAVW